MIGNWIKLNLQKDVSVIIYDEPEVRRIVKTHVVYTVKISKFIEVSGLVMQCHN